MEYLSLKEIISLKNDINIELELLLSNKAAVTKPNSLQLLFLSIALTCFLIPTLIQNSIR
ncbi:MAG: hypothetical protein ACYDA4_14725 [Ignavibacteriaceae bacterium]